MSAAARTRLGSPANAGSTRTRAMTTIAYLPPSAEPCRCLPAHVAAASNPVGTALRAIGLLVGMALGVAACLCLPFLCVRPASRSESVESR